MINRQGTKHLLQLSLTIITLCIIFGYAFYATHDFIFGQQILISEPGNGNAFSTSSVIVKGQGIRVKDMSLNDRPIILDNEGNFSENLILAPGYNIFLLVSHDKFGRKKEHRLEYIYRVN